MLKNKILFVIGILLCVPLINGCSAKEPDFAVFLLSEQMSAGEALTIPLKDLPLEDSPFISMDDVVLYNHSSYEITLTESAIEGVYSMEIPVHGMPFVVVAQGERIFMGAFWTPISSLSYSGIVAMPSLVENFTALKFDLGYPAVEFFEGVDLRSDERIINVFTKAGKLAGKE